MEAFNRHPATTNNAVARRADPWLGVRALGALQVYGADSHHRRPGSLTIYRNAAAFAARARRPRSRRAPGVVIPDGWRGTIRP
jgi:hypothetical protein